MIREALGRHASRPMRIVSVVLMLAMVLQFVPSGAFAVQAMAAPPDDQQTVTVPVVTGSPDQIIVKYYKQPGEDVESSDQPAGPMKMQSFAAEDPAGLTLIDVDPAEDMAAVLDELRADDNVAYAEPNYTMYAQDDPTPPSDELFPQQWALDEIDAMNGWDSATHLLGTNAATPTIVAVVDTGVDYTHRDLEHRLAPATTAKNFITGETGYDAIGDNSSIGHGTHVAGVIAAETGNDIGIAGVAGTLPVSVMPLKALDDGGVGTMYDVAQAIRWAADNGAKVINLSLGARLPDYPKTLAEAVQHAQDNGALVVAAAGNDAANQSSDRFYPAALPGVVSVAATGTDHHVASFSNRGTISAPGVDVLSTDRADDGDGSEYGEMTGTSIAAPQVAGVAAVLFTVYPDKSPTDIASMMSEGCSRYNEQYILSLDGALGTPTALDDDLQILSPVEAGDGYVTGKVTISVKSSNPETVARVDFYLDDEDELDEEGEPANLIGQYLHNPAVDPAESGIFEIEWDSAGLKGTTDGEHELIALAYDDSNPDPLCSTYRYISVLNTTPAGLVLQIVKPPQDDGSLEPAAQAPVIVCHVSPDGDESVLEKVWEGNADDTGTVTVPNSAATAGNDFLVIASGSEPGFVYMQTVSAPGTYTIDSTGTRIVTVSAARRDDSPIIGATGMVELLGKNVPGTGDADEPLHIDRYNHVPPLPIGPLNGSGEIKIAVSPGAYAFRVEDKSQQVFLSSRAMDISSDLATDASVELGGGVGTCAVQLEPDAALKAQNITQLDISISDETGRTLALENVGESEITLSPGDYAASVTATFQEKGISYVEYCLSVSSRLARAVGLQKLQFGGPTEISVIPTPTDMADDEGKPCPVGEYQNFLSRFTDQYDNSIQGFEWYYVVDKDDSRYWKPIAVWVEVTKREPNGTYSFVWNERVRITNSYDWLVDQSNSPGIYAVREYLEDTYNPLVSPTSPTVEFTVSAPSEQPPGYEYPIQLALEGLTGDPLGNPAAWLVEQDGAETRVLDELWEDWDSGMLCSGAELEQNGSYGVIVCGSSADLLGSQVQLMFYVPLSAGIDPSNWTISASEQASALKQLSLSLDDEDGEPITEDEVTYTVDRHLGDRTISWSPGAITGSAALWVSPDAELTIRAERPYIVWSSIDEEIGRHGILAVSPRFIAGENTSGYVTLGGTNLVPLSVSVPDDSTWRPQWSLKGYVLFQDDQPVSPMLYGPMCVSPGEYRLQALAEQEHFTGTWDYWYDHPGLVLEPGSQVVNVSLGSTFTAEISLEDGAPVGGYGLGDPVGTVHRITDEYGNAVVGILAGSLWRYGEATAQTHMQIAPYFSVAGPGGAQVCPPYKSYGDDWDIIGEWCSIVDGDDATLSPLGDSTYTHGSWTIPTDEDTPGGQYTATIELGAGPNGTIADSVAFTVDNKPGAPVLSGPQSPTNNPSVTITGTGAFPGGEVTLSWSCDGVEDYVTGVVDPGGLFSITVGPLTDGEYVFTAYVTVDQEAGSESLPVTVVVDTVPPSAPTDLDGEALVGPQVHLQWARPADGDGVDHYLVLRDRNRLGVSVDLPSEGLVEYTDSIGLLPNTLYKYEVLAVDEAGNESAASDAITITAIGGDTVAPTAPSDVAVAFDPGGLATVTWKISVDNVAVAKYRIYRFKGEIPPGGLAGAVPIGELSVISGNPALAYHDTGLAASTQYTYCVTAVDAAGNESSPGSTKGTTLGMTIARFTVAVPKNERGVLTPGGLFRFTVASEPRRQALVAVTYDSVDDGSGMTATTTLSELLGQGQPSGVYTGTWALPDGATQVISVVATVTDGVATAPPTSALSGLPLSVAGSLSVTVSATHSADLQLLNGGTLVLWDDSHRTGGTVSISGSADATYVLSGLRADTDYTLTARAPAGQLLMTESAVTVRPGVDTAITVTPSLPASLAVIVLDDFTGEPVPGVGVAALDDEWCALGYCVSNEQGSAVSSVPFAFAGTPLVLSVSIPENLYGIYRDTRRDFVLKPGENTATIRLGPLPVATIVGTVSDQYSQPLAGAEIRATIGIDRRTLNLSTVADANGEYSLRVPIGDSGRLSFSHRTAYQKSVDLTNLVGGGTKTVNQSLTTAAIISASLFARRAGDTVDSPVERLAGYLPQLSLTATNLRTGTKETVDCSKLPFLRVFQAEPNDQVSLTLDGGAAGLTSETVVVTLNEARNGATAFYLVEKGRIKASVRNLSGQSLAGLSRTALIYNSAAPIAKASPTKIYTSNYPDFMSQPLPAGDYTVVLYWGSNAAGYSGATLWAPAATYDFWSGTSAPPHAILQAHVTDGELTDLGDVGVTQPGSSNTHLFAIDGNSFTASVSEAAPGSLVTLRLAYACDTSIHTPYGLNIWADVPPGTTLVDGSVTVRTLAGKEPAVTTAGRIKLAFGDPFSDGTTESPAGVLTYQVRVPTTPTWPTIQARAYADYQYQATEQPFGMISAYEDLGSPTVRVPVLSITAPPTSVGNLINLSGKAPPGATVDVYDGTLYIGETVAHAYGTWKMSQVMLPDRGTPGAHYLVAQTKQGDATLTTAGTKVIVGSPDPSLESLMMCQLSGGYQVNKVTYYPATGASSFPYSIKPGAQSYYEVKFSDNSRVENVRILVGKSGQYLTVPTHYDDAVGAFVATTPSVLMGDVYVRFDVIPEAYQKQPLPDEDVLRSGMPDLWRDAIVTKLLGGQAISAQADGDATETDGNPATARVTLANGKVMDFTISATATSHTPTDDEIAAVAAGEPPAYHFAITVVDVETSGGKRARIEASWIMPAAEASATPAGQSMSAMAAGDVAVKVLGESPIEGGLGVSDLYDTIKSGFEYKEKMDKLSNLLDKITSSCQGADRAGYQATADSLAERLLANLSIKYGLQLAGIALGATGVGVGGAVAVWAVSGILTEIGDAKWDTAFKQLEKNVATDDDCKDDDKDDGDNDDDSDDPDPDEPPTVSPRYLIDPSGYVYEGVPDNRLPGVTAWAYEVINGLATVWDSSWTEQANPLTSDSEGKYGWDVPEGDWRVVWAKEGYEAAGSELIHVPPPRTDVNVGLVSLEPPTVTSVLLNADGTYVEVAFSKYMRVDTVTASTFAVTPDDPELTIDGPLSGSVTPVDSEVDPLDSDRLLAQVFRFTPATALTGDTTYTVLIGGAVQSYAGIPLGSDHTAVRAVPDPAQPPIGDVTGATVAAGEQSLTLTWTDPASAQLAYINVYSRTASGSYGSAVAIAAGAQSCTLRELQGGTSYTIKITTVDSLGRESTGIERIGIPELQQIGEVTGATVSAGSRSLTVTWADPASERLASIRVRYRLAGGSFGSALTVAKGAHSCTFSGLQAGKTYEIKITTVDSLGRESAGVEVAGVPEEPLIGEVTGAQVAAGQQSLTVAWTDLASEQLASISVRYRLVSGSYGSPIAVAKGTQTCTLSGLQGGATYKIKITTIDSLGRESTGVVVTGVPTSPPVIPPDSGDGPGPSTPGTPAGDTVKFIAIAGGGTFSGWDDEITLEFPAGTFAGSDSLTILRDGDPAAATDMIPVSPVYEIQTSGGQPGQPVLLTIKYDPAALNGLDPARIGIYRQDDNDPSKWVFVGGVVDPVAGTISISLDHFSSYAAFARQVTFSDLTGHWARPDIETLASRGIVSGIADDRFSPDTDITRAELAKLLVSMVTQDTTRSIQLVSPLVATFRDVPANAWYYQYVETATKAGLVTGDGGLFRPNDPVTREEMAAMAIRAMQLQDKAAILKDRTPAFEDSGDIAVWARGSVSLAIFKGLMRGITGTTFVPRGLSTRAQAAVVVKRAMERLGLLERTIVVKGTLHLSQIEGTHIELTAIEGGKTVTYVLEPDGGPDGSIAKQLNGIIGTEVRLLAIPRTGASIYMRGPGLRVLEVWRPGCPLCPPEE